MRQYEYKIIHQTTLLTLIEPLGKAGWELTTYWPDQYSFIFKRLILD